MFCMKNCSLSRNFLLSAWREDSHPAPVPADGMESRSFTSQFGFFVQLSLIYLCTQLLYIIIISNILRDHAAVHWHNCWHNLSVVLKCKTTQCTQMSKSDHISSWHGKPELYKGMINLAGVFILTLFIGVWLGSINGWWDSFWPWPGLHWLSRLWNWEKPKYPVSYYLNQIYWSG